MNLCDFCLEPLPGNVPSFTVHAQMRQAFVLGDITVLDDSEWYCCAPCAVLVHAAQWEDLMCRFIILKIKRGDLLSSPTAIMPMIQTLISGWSPVFGYKFYVNPL